MFRKRQKKRYLEFFNFKWVGSGQKGVIQILRGGGLHFFSFFPRRKKKFEKFHTLKLLFYILHSFYCAVQRRNYKANYKVVINFENKNAPLPFLFFSILKLHVLYLRVSTKSLSVCKQFYYCVPMCALSRPYPGEWYRRNHAGIFSL